MRSIAEKVAPLFVIAAIIAYLAEKYNMPQLTSIAVGIVGVFALILGTETLIRGKIEWFDRGYSRMEYYSGLSARLWGLLFIFFGAGVLLYTVVEWMSPGMADAFLVSLGKNRGGGILCLAFGFVTFLFGLIRLIAGSAHSPELRSAWVDLGFRVRGFVGVVVGILLGALGVWLMFMP